MNDTLLGVPRETLLKAMEICPVEWRDGETYSLLAISRDGNHFVERYKADKADKYVTLDRWYPDHSALAHAEHAFRVWLVGRSCWLEHDERETTVFASSNIQLASDPHHLTATALAVVKIGEKI